MREYNNRDKGAIGMDTALGSEHSIFAEAAVQREDDIIGLKPDQTSAIR
jgi:hypothetical protein